MKIKANYNEMSNTSLKLKEEGIKLDKEVDNLLNLLEEVKENWQGTDSDIYVSKAEAYFKNIKQISSSIKEFASFIDYSQVTYEKIDVNWKKEVEEAGVNFGSEELKLEDEQ